MNISLAGIEKGHYRFDITDAGFINSAVVPFGTDMGDEFTITYGFGLHVPDTKVLVKWAGEKVEISNVIDGLINSIKCSEVYKGGTVDSEEFYLAVADLFNKCECDDPKIDKLYGRVVGVDLDYPDIPRSSSRYIVFLSSCSICSSPLTYGTNVGGFSITGKERLMELAEKESEYEIDWKGIVTSRQGMS